MENPFDSLRIYQYPDDATLWGGVPAGIGYEYVSSTYVTGLVNYHKERLGQLLLLRVYSDEDEFGDWVKKVNDDFEDHKNWFHYNFSDARDDVVILSMLYDGTYVMYYNDRDCSDCCIYRWNADEFSGFEDFCDHIYNFYKERVDDEKDCIEDVVRINSIPGGWLKL